MSLGKQRMSFGEESYRLGGSDQRGFYVLLAHIPQQARCLTSGGVSVDQLLPPLLGLGKGLGRHQRLIDDAYTGFEHVQASPRRRDGLMGGFLVLVVRQRRHERLQSRDGILQLRTRGSNVPHNRPIGLRKLFERGGRSGGSRGKAVLIVLCHDELIEGDQGLIACVHHVDLGHQLIAKRCLPNIYLQQGLTHRKSEGDYHANDDHCGNGPRNLALYLRGERRNWRFFSPLCGGATFWKNDVLPLGRSRTRLPRRSERKKGDSTRPRRAPTTVATLRIARLPSGIQHAERYLIRRAVSVTLDMKGVLGFLPRHK